MGKEVAALTFSNLGLFALALVAWWLELSIIAVIMTALAIITMPQLYALFSPKPEIEDIIARIEQLDDEEEDDE